MSYVTKEKGSLYAAIATLIVALLLAIASVSTTKGELTARVTTLEKATDKSVSKDEWRTFRQDIKDRLDRIENKLDKVNK